MTKTRKPLSTRVKPRDDLVSYHNGARAARAGMPMDDNPYTVWDASGGLSLPWRAWRKGWLSASGPKAAALARLAERDKYPRFGGRKRRGLCPAS